MIKSAAESGQEARVNEDNTTAKEQRLLERMSEDPKLALEQIRALVAEEGGFSERFRYLVVSAWGSEMTGPLAALVKPKPTNFK